MAIIHRKYGELRARGGARKRKKMSERSFLRPPDAEASSTLDFHIELYAVILTKVRIHDLSAGLAASGS